MTKKIKLVLSGSGTRYPVFAGAIRKLLEDGYEIEEVLDDLDGGYMKNIVESDINGVRVVPITYAMRED